MRHGKLLSTSPVELAVTQTGSDLPEHGNAYESKLDRWRKRLPATTYPDAALGWCPYDLSCRQPSVKY